MVEIELLICKKLKYYQDQFDDAEKRGLSAHKKHYKDCIEKLVKMLNILEK